MWRGLCRCLDHEFQSSSDVHADWNSASYFCSTALQAVGAIPCLVSPGVFSFSACDAASRCKAPHERYHGKCNKPPVAKLSESPVLLIFLRAYTQTHSYVCRRSE